MREGFAVNREREREREREERRRERWNTVAQKP
ncbi:hypothetical protein THAOC_31624, partial [Thalassiosira oceanica]